jgi:hypothetical protein
MKHAPPETIGGRYASRILREWIPEPRGSGGGGPGVLGLTVGSAVRHAIR